MSEHGNSSLKKLVKNYPDMKIESTESYVINGELVCTTNFITSLYNIHRNQIGKWVKQGLQPHRYSLPKLMLFSPIDVILWHKTNIKSTSKASKFAGSDKYDEDESKKDLSEVSKDEADRRLQIQKVLNEEIKHKELIGKLIPAEDTDKALAELGAVHVAQYRGDLKLLPMLLENKPKHEIQKLLDAHYKARVEDMDKLSKVKDHVVTIYERSLENA
jgi:hypothetical protein